MAALREGVPPPAPDPAITRFETAASYDADVLRAFAESRSCLALTQEVLARPGIRAAIDEVGTREPPRPPGPDRRQLLQLLAG